MSEIYKRLLPASAPTYRRRYAPFSMMLPSPFIGVETDEAVTTENCFEINKKLNMEMVKTLFLCSRQQTSFYLFITTGDNPFPSKGFGTALGISRVSFAPAELMEKMPSTKIGAGCKNSIRQGTSRNDAPQAGVGTLFAGKARL